MENFNDKSDSSGKDEAAQEHFQRIREARRAFKPGGTGHIDFVTRETGTYPPLINMGKNQDGTPCSPKDWVAMYHATYGYNPEYDAPESEETDDEFKERALHHAQWAFGPSGQSANPELLSGIRKELVPESAAAAEKEELATDDTETQSNDPLQGTQYEGISNEDLYHGQSVFGEDGRQHNPTEGDEYRKAFRYYLEQRGWL